MAYIYKITNLINNHSYIGKTEAIDPKDRWKEHLREATKERNGNRAIYRAIKKYGKDNFSFEVLEETTDPNAREQYYINFYDTYHDGYNETLGGDGKSYLELPEQEICKYYIAHGLKETARCFNHDIETIKRVLYKNNIRQRTQSEQMILTKSYPVAQLDPNTEEIIHIFSSVSEAEQAFGNSRHISDVVNGKRKTCKGFKWKKIDN